MGLETFGVLVTFSAVSRLFIKRHCETIMNKILLSHYGFHELLVVLLKLLEICNRESRANYDCGVRSRNKSSRNFRSFIYLEAIAQI
jgi:hypothetical protein